MRYKYGPTSTSKMKPPTTNLGNHQKLQHQSTHSDISKWKNQPTTPGTSPPHLHEIPLKKNQPPNARNPPGLSVQTSQLPRKKRRGPSHRIPTKRLHPAAPTRRGLGRSVRRERIGTQQNEQRPDEGDQRGGNVVRSTGLSPPHQRQRQHDRAGNFVCHDGARHG